MDEAIPSGAVAHTVGEYFTAVTARDLGRWQALFAENSVVHDPVGAAPVEGEAARRELWQGVVGPFETLLVSPEHSFYAGSGAAVQWSGRGRGINGREVAFAGITVFEVSEEGKIQTLMAYWDPAAMMLELAGDA